MTTLYLAWQDQDSRGWFPVGRLDVNASSEPNTYAFSYINGAAEVRQGAPFFPVPGFPELERRYCSTRLFPLFRNRLMNLARPDRPGYLRQLGLTTDDWSPAAELAAPLNRAHNDGFEVFPPIIPDAAGRFSAQTTLHGLRYVNQHSIERSASLRVGEPLYLSYELSNPTSVRAVSVRTEDEYILGWLPRYLTEALHQRNKPVITGAKATVVQVNLDAPLSHRLLIDFSGKLPPGFRMEDLPQYQPIAPRAGGYPTNKSSGKNADTV